MYNIINSVPIHDYLMLYNCGEHPTEDNYTTAVQLRNKQKCCDCCITVIIIMQFTINHNAV